MTRQLAVFSFAAFFALVSCTPTEETTACTADYDCVVGQVCGTADGADAAQCTAAASGEQRTFGEITLDFASNDAAYLLSVVSIPAGAAAVATSEILFKLTPPSTAASRVRIARLVPASMQEATQSSQLSFDQERYERTSKMLAERARTTAALKRPLLAAASCDQDCGDTQMCWQGACTDAPSVKFVSSTTSVSCHLASVVTAGADKINVVVDSSLQASEQDAVDIVESFASTFPSELGFLGLSAHNGAVDRDGDGRLTVVFTNRTQGTVDMSMVGFFDNRDFFDTADADATGNAADILWARAPTSGNNITTELLVGTLVHEYQHLVSYAVRVQARLPQGVQEALWLDEGLSHLLEDLTGWGASSLRNVEATLAEWNEAPLAKGNPSASEDPLQRGKAFMLMRHLVDQRGNASSLITTLLNDEATGLEHASLREGLATALANWQLAVFTTNNDEVTQQGAHAYDYRATTESSVTGQKVGIDPRGDYTDARGDDLTLGGPEVPEVDDPQGGDLTDASIKESGTQLYLVTGGSGTVVLRGTADADADLHVVATRIR